MLVGAAFTPTVLFVSAANRVILPNLSEIPYQARTLLYFLGGFFLFWSLNAMIFLRATRSLALRHVMRASTFLGAAVLVFDAVSAFAGGITYKFPAVVSLDLAAALACAVFAWGLRPGALLSVQAVASAVLLCYDIPRHALAYRDFRARQYALLLRADAEAGTPGSPAPVWERGNVYHILLDGFQPEVLRVLEDEWPQRDDFTFHPRFVAGYVSTVWSLPQLLTGRTYREGESLRAWLAEAQVGGLWAELHRAGVGVHLYPSPFWADPCPLFATRCREPRGGARARPTAATVDLWFLGLLPRSGRWLANWGLRSLANPQALRARDETLVNFSLTEHFAVSQDGRRHDRRSAPELAAETFERLIEQEPSRSARGQYIFVHVILPHEPYAVDAQCAPLPESAPMVLPAYINQARCALHLVTQMMRRLDALGRLDDALVIIHSDHGMPPRLADDFLLQFGGTLGDDWAPWPFPHAPDELWEHPDYRNGAAMIAQRARALLLLKFPDNTGPTEPEMASQRWAHMLDVAPTILRHFGLPTDDRPGLPLQSIRTWPHRELAFFLNYKCCGPASAMPKDGHFAQYVLHDGKWTYRRDIAVLP